MNSFVKRPELNRSTYLKVVTVIAAAVAIGTTPALAKKRHSLHGLQMSAQSFDNHYDDGGVPISGKRATAVHDCSVQASKLSNAAWEESQILVYGECMAQHGEMP